MAFEAILAQMSGAIRVHGTNGFRISFDVDDKGKEEVKELIDYRGMKLYLVVAKHNPGKGSA